VQTVGVGGQIDLVGLVEVDPADVVPRAAVAVE